MEDINKDLQINTDENKRDMDKTGTKETDLKETGIEEAKEEAEEETDKNEEAGEETDKKNPDSIPVDELQGIKFEMKLQRNDLFFFMIYTFYHSFFGVAITLFGMGIIGLAVYNAIVTGTSTNWLTYFIVGILLAGGQPLIYYSNSKNIMKTRKEFIKPITYLFNDDGMTVMQDETTGSLTWRQIGRVVDRKDRFYVFQGKKNASVLLKAQIKDLKELEQMFREKKKMK